MFCRNCAEELNEGAVVCVKCGVSKGVGNNFCPNCGNKTNESAVVCTSCGCAIGVVKNQNAKSKLAAGLLGIFLGVIGVHNFYLGYNGKGVAQLLITLLSCGFLSPISAIWGLIEGILILTGNEITTDANGVPLSD